MLHFPESYACAITNGFSETLPYSKKYLGGKLTQPLATGTVSILVKNDYDMTQFMVWYESINWGADVFLMELPLFGTTKYWEVRITSTPATSTPGTKVTKRTIDLDIEIME